MFSRRHFLLAGGGLGVAAVVVGVLPKFAAISALISEANAGEVFEVTHSDSEWRSKLSAEQYEILREEGTERAYSSALNNEHREGTFACAGCELALFSSATKFDSRTGWPSFGRRWTAPSRRARTAASAWCVTRSTAGAAAGTWGTFSMTGRNPRACAIA